MLWPEVVYMVAHEFKQDLPSPVCWQYRRSVGNHESLLTEHYKRQARQTHLKMSWAASTKRRKTNRDRNALWSHSDGTPHRMGLM